MPAWEEPWRRRRRSEISNNQEVEKKILTKSPQ